MLWISKMLILLVETVKPTNVSWTKDEMNRLEGELMSNQTSDIVTEEDGIFFSFSFLKQETAVLISSFTFPALIQTCQMC